MVVLKGWHLGGYAQLEATKMNRKYCIVDLDLDKDVNIRLSDDEENRCCSEILEFVKSQKETTSEQKALLDEKAKEDLYRTSLDALDMFFINSLKAANIDGLMGIDENSSEIIYDFEKTDLSLIKKVFYEGIDKVNALNNKFIHYKSFDFFESIKTFKPCKDVETIDELGNKWELGDIVVYCQTNEPSIICKLTNAKVMLSDGCLVEKCSCILVKKGDGTPVKFGTIFG